MFLICAAGLALLPISHAGGDTIREPDYKGTAGPGATVLFEVTRKQGVPVSAQFQVKNIELSCDDGTAPRVTPQPVRFKFRDRRTFDGDRFFVSDNSGNQEYYRVTGRLFGDGRRAQGFILIMRDALDPPRPGTPEVPDCSTFGKVSWNAERVGRR